ncbi:MAG: CARDB domain-containing protein [Candidatus Bipolaricaulia bacterium]
MSTAARSNKGGITDVQQQSTILAATTVDKPGIYIVTVIVDPDNKINERDETNNIAERSIYVQ